MQEICNGLNLVYDDGQVIAKVADIIELFYRLIKNKIDTIKDLDERTISVSEIIEPQNKQGNENEDADYDNAAIYDTTFLLNLLQHNKQYEIDKHFLSNHPKLSWIIRANVINIIMQVCEDFAFKRDTFHLCIYNTARRL